MVKLRKDILTQKSVLCFYFLNIKTSDCISVIIKFTKVNDLYKSVGGRCNPPIHVICSQNKFNLYLLISVSYITVQLMMVSRTTKF